VSGTSLSRANSHHARVPERAQAERREVYASAKRSLACRMAERSEIPAKHGRAGQIVRQTDAAIRRNSVDWTVPMPGNSRNFHERRR
jgi:hypothetical protein